MTLSGRALAALAILFTGALAYNAAVVEAAPPRIDCPRSDVEVRITNPKPNDTVSRAVQIEGSAKVPDFQSYQLAVSPAGRDAYAPVGSEVRQPVVNGQLGVWDSAGVPEGGYSIRLRVFDNARQYCEAFVSVTVNNKAATPTPFPTDEPPDTPIPPGAPTSVPQIVLPGETPAPTRTPRATATPGGSSGGLNFDAIAGSMSDLGALLARTCLFGIAVGAGIMLVVGVIYFVRRLF